MQSSGKGRTARPKQWGIVDSPAIPDWEAAHTFLEVARCGSFRSAAQKLKQSINVLRRRLDIFERDMGVSLLIRNINGVQLTAEGRNLYAAVLQMESASFDLLLARNLSGKQIEGEVSLSVTEGLGSGWMIPQLAAFQRANPGLIVNLRCGQSPPDLLRLEADVSVQLERPKALDVKAVRLGRLHFLLFAAKSYLDAHGYPASAADLAKHRFVVMADEKRRWEEIYERLLPDVSPASQVSLRNNISSAHFSAIANGAGIGFLPTYIPALGASVIPLDLGINHALDIWLAYRMDARRIARIGRTIEWIMQIYDPRRYPWFRDELIHPENFPDVYKGRPQINLVGEFLGRG